MSWLNYLFGNKPTPINYQGLKIFFNPRSIDPATLAEVFLQKQYHPNNIKFAPTVVDIGANIGLFSLWAIKNLKTKRLIAVEMNHRNFKLLKTNIKTNLLPCTTILLNRAFFSQKTVVSETKVSSFLNTCYRLIPQKGPIKTITFEEIILAAKKPVDLLKIDVEGSEKYLITNKNCDLMKKYVRFAAIETHPQYGCSTNDILSFLHRANFKTTVRRYLNLLCPKLVVFEVVIGENLNQNLR